MKSINYVFGAYFLVSSLYILYSVFGHSHSTVAPTLAKRDVSQSEESLVERDAPKSQEPTVSAVASSAFETATTTVLSPSSTATAESNKTFNLRLQSWNIRSAFLLKDYVPIEDSLKAISKTTFNPTTNKDAVYYWNWKENAWTARRIALTQHVEFYKPDVFAVQEALHVQVEDLASLLSDYAWIGVGRNDNKTGGEFEAIFYNKKTVTLKSWDTFWLSDNPFVPSITKCASAIRDATVASFVSVKDNVPFTVINTHWDEKCNSARMLAASLIKHRAAYEFEKTNAPVILTGDFNSEAYGYSNGGYEIITGAADPVQINSTFAEKYKSSISTSFSFADSYFKTPAENRLGNFATFTGFYKFLDFSKFTRIDFHMTGQVNNGNNGLNTTRYVVPDMFSDVGFHLSDHRAVITEHVISK